MARISQHWNPDPFSSLDEIELKIQHLSDQLQALRDGWGEHASVDEFDTFRVCVADPDADWAEVPLTHA